MAVEYILRTNTLDTTGESCRAHVVNSESFRAADLVEYVSRTNSGVSKPEIAAIEAALEDAFAYFLSQGKCFHSPLLRLFLSIRGSYKQGEFPSSKNVHANACVGPLLQQAAESASVKAGHESVKWAIERVVDVTTGQADSVLTAGRSIRIEGKGLTLAGNDAAVEFTSTAGGSPIMVQAPQLAVNTPSLLVLDVPESLVSGNVAPGPYRLSIITYYNSKHAQNSTAHTINYDVDLTAQPVATP
jgi:hypothetical protein